MNRWRWVAAWVALGTGVAQADWQVVGELTAGGAPTEVALEREVRVIQIECTAGTVQVETLWVLEGEAENPIPVARTLQTGEVQAIDLGGDRALTGIRIRAGGEGACRLSVK
ncbi:MAG: hypothetical protein KBC66_04525 [Kiritimatiellae bacterium]|jgi:hypothetical protein|nr:hypothetical protein [Kiritimatiellia bacterium]NLD89707.1 hypothetical protein [Lentisphaerota bacterium]HPC19257.1 hypothetical protein [Kiritimatiellia bacterium]HQN79924.1 hypothetical protein [Kiritimatiellia bacterium]HQQ61224.1 hypothetical protein [Kiritimatiellia bacterium]